MTFWNAFSYNDDEDEKESPEHRAIRIEDTMAMGLIGRDELTLAWAASSKRECQENQRRFLKATQRNSTL